MATVLPPMGTNVRIPLLQILDVLSKFKEQKGVREDQPILGQVLRQIQADPERAQYYIGQAMPRMRSSMGRETMLGWTGKPPGAEQLYTLRPGERLVGPRGAERARGIPIVEKGAKKQVLVKPGDRVWDPIAGKEVFHNPATSERDKRYILKPEEILTDPEGKFKARGAPKPEAKMTDKEIGDMVRKYSDLEAKIRSGVMDPNMLTVLGLARPELARMLLQKDISGALEDVLAEKRYWTERLVEKERKRRFPNAKQDNIGWYITRNGKKFYLRPTLGGQ